MSQDSLIGRQLANYRIERALGRGGMAMVYYGWDVKLERPVAIKLIDARYRDDPAYAQRFVREAQAVAQWRHENIVQIYYADDDEGLYYFVMEYIDGMDLCDVLRSYAERGALMPHEDVLTIGHAIAAALDCAHEKGFVHRDVKPANALISYDDRVVLTDFGLALDVAQGTQGEVFGSSHYVAPEQARNSAEACPQSDLYSLGVILYEMLTGVVPFDDPSPTTVALQHVTQPPPPPRSINPMLSEAVEAVLLKALHKSPEERFPTGQALVEALEAALNVPQPAPETLLKTPARSLSSVSVSNVIDWERTSKEAAASPTDLVGSQLDEYRLEALLGQGGMAQVYRGVDVKLKRWVAIKVINAPFRSDSDYTMRFEREAQAIAQLEHPHIVRLYRYGEAENLLYMAMQYVEGADLCYVLDSYRKGGECIAPCDALRMAREICSALDYAHEKGIIHRDVKPSNVMLDTQGNAILADFGLALLTEVGTRGEIFGSPRYIAPEQAISSAAVVPQSDIYAVGVILYEIFTGQVPFDAEQPLDVAMQHVNEPPPPPRQVRPELSPALEAVLLKALAKDPSDRYQSGAALIQALEEALAAPPESPDLLLTIPQQVAKRMADRPLPNFPTTQPPVTQPPPSQPPPDAEPESPPEQSSTQEGLITWEQSSTPGIPVEEEPLASQPEPVPPPPVAQSPETTTPPPQTRVPAAREAAAPEPAPAVQPAPPSGKQGSSRRWLLWGALGLAGLGVVALLLVGGFFLTRSLWEELVPGEPTKEAGAVRTTPDLEAVASAATATATPLPEPTATLVVVEATATGVPPTPSPTPEPAPLTAYDLQFVTEGETALFLANRSLEPLSLVGLQLAPGKDAIYGPDWDVEELPAGACVAAVQDAGNYPAAPEGLCSPTEPLAVLQRDGPKRFWKDKFDVVYAGEEALTCEPSAGACALQIPLEAARYMLLVKSNSKGLFIINEGNEALSLDGLRFVKSSDDDDEGNDGGPDWGIETLQPGECVAIWHDEDAPELPTGISCERVGSITVITEKKEQFWREDFRIVRGEEQRLGTCSKGTSYCFVPQSDWSGRAGDDD